jgi:hypothetical protein
MRIRNAEIFTAILMVLIYFMSKLFLGSGYGLDLDSVKPLDPDQVRKKNYLQDKVKKFHV